jgi:ComF family protein
MTFHQVSINGHLYTSSDGQLKELYVASAAVFEEPINTIIYKFKYDSDVLLAKDLACLMVFAWPLLKEKNDYPVDSICLVPVPLYKKRQKQRGFNQSELLAWQLSRLINIKTETKLLRRIRNTGSQQELNKTERKKNVAGAFQAVSKMAFANRHVILIDDVCTSGSTLIECAQAAMTAGALSVCALTVAYVP